MHNVVTIETPGLGDRSYLVHDGEPPSSSTRSATSTGCSAPRTRRASRITHVLETHIHNDYVTGGLALARAAGADYVVAAAEDVSFSRTGVADGDVFAAGGLSADRAGHARAHARPPVLRAASEGQPGRRVHRRVDAVRRRRAAPT